MDFSHLSKQFPGELRPKDDYQYFLPGDVFLAKNLNFSSGLIKQLERAVLELGRLSVKTANIPNFGLFMMSFIKKEALQSSRIEGTQIQINDTFQVRESDVAEEKRDDWNEVIQYINALKKAIDELGKLPICERLIREIHKVLLQQNRGYNKTPGEYRRVQNRIGGTQLSNASFVPPSAEIVPHAMKNLEAFVHNDDLEMPHLIKVALIHYQFETIHPFLDGNGRIGRMLVPLYLLENKILNSPTLYISDFFEKHRADYYTALNNARESKWAMLEWISFFLKAITETAKDGISTIDKIVNLKQRLETDFNQLGRRAENAKRLLNALLITPLIDSEKIIEELKVSPATAHNLLKDFVKLSILREITGKRKNRQFLFTEYLNILSQ